MNNYLAPVTNWILSGMKYQDGLALLLFITKKPKFNDIFLGRNKTMHRKLAYEICKGAKLADSITWKTFIAQIQLTRTASTTDLMFIENTESSLPSDYNLTTNQNPPDFVNSLDNKPEKVLFPNTQFLHTELSSKYPPIIHRIISRMAELYQNRSKMHTQMVNLSSSNDEPFVSQRLELFNRVKSFTAELEILYAAKKGYDQQGTIPSENELFLTKKPIPSILKPELPLLDKLKKRKKDLQTSNHKDKAMLRDLNVISNPLAPEDEKTKQSARELTLIDRIKDRSVQIDAVEYQIVKLKSKC
jgi:hypothetical protein